MTAVLIKLLECKKLEPFLRHIRFPQYKNLEKNTKIDFSYPISALVGANGTNKSSILRALHGSPGYNNLGNYWFSTSIDPIEETGDGPSCFIYGYWNQASAKVVEVLKTRVSKPNDPDYWEPSRPIISYGMERMPDLKVGDPIPAGRSKTRWEAIAKHVEYLDFRESLSAFDKFFYHGQLRNKPNTEKSKKDFIRARAPHLKLAILEAKNSVKYRKSERVHGINRSLTVEELKYVCMILDRSYTEIKLILHSLFNCDAYSCLMSTPGRKYSEAFAGSGEFAVVRIVTSILSAPNNSLILLDEPEVSLHPGAQDRLLEFLTQCVKQKKHQIVISTHSPTIVKRLPPEAIKVLVMDKVSGKVRLPRQASLPEEAFFHLGEPMHGKYLIIVEDALAKSIVSRALYSEGEAMSNLIEIQFFPGGAQTLWSHYLPIFAAEGRVNILILLDGDERPAERFTDPDLIGPADEYLIASEVLKICKTEIKFPVDGSSGKANINQVNLAQRKFVKWAMQFVDYLPGGKIPEEFLWERMSRNDIIDDIADNNYKHKFEKLTRSQLGIPEFEAVSSSDIFATQRRCVATISLDDPELCELRNRVVKFAREISEAQKPLFEKSK